MRRVVYRIHLRAIIDQGLIFGFSPHCRERSSRSSDRFVFSDRPYKKEHIVHFTIDNRLCRLFLSGLSARALPTVTARTQVTPEYREICPNQNQKTPHPA